MKPSAAPIPSAQHVDSSPQDDARSFDVVVIGTGSFGPVFAPHFFQIDATRTRRILLLDSGSLVDEHAQNIGLPRFNPPGPVEQDPGVACKGLQMHTGRVALRRVQMRAL